jgi:uncharacterized protein involved in exopolysaccharide biosynthesis
VDQLSLANPDSDRHYWHPPVLRELVAIGFRRRRLMAICFWGAVLGATLVAIAQPSRFTSEMKIMVKRERVDPVVTPAVSSAPQFAPEVTEEELNSEVELLKTRDLLEKVVLACGLQNQADVTPSQRLLSKALALIGTYAGAKRNPDQQLSRAVDSLQKKLSIEVMKKTNLLIVTYESSNPQSSARVLNSLAELYLQKHLDVHRPPGAVDFFHQQSQQFHNRLDEAQARLSNFNRQADVISSQLEKDSALQKRTEFESTLKQTEGSIAETEQRIGNLEKQVTSIPTRMVTQVRKLDDGPLLSQVRTNLLTLELKRTELLQKFEPTYRPVRELEAQISQTRAALEESEKAQLHEETIDRDPTNLMLSGDLAKAKADLAGLRARAEATVRTVEMYGQSARSLDSKEITQNDLLRTVKAEEERYLLYLRKEEEARISEALDRKRIINVAIAEAAIMPAFPSNHRSLTMLVGLLLASVISFGMAWSSEYLDPTFRTPDEVRSFLNISVLAALPKNDKEYANTYVSRFL